MCACFSNNTAAASTVGYNRTFAPFATKQFQSCLDLPEEFEISYYLPGRFFKFFKESESSDSDTLHCDFCKQTHGVQVPL